VWVNGKWSGRQPDPYLPFEIRIDRDMIPGGENLIVVRTDNSSRPGGVPGAQRGWRNFGGLLRGVELCATETCKFDQIAACATPHAQGGDLTVRATIDNGGSNDTEVTSAAVISDAAGNVLTEWMGDSLVIPPGTKGETVLAHTVPGVEPWSPQAPHLYTLKVTLQKSGTVLETRELRVGFRSLQVTEGALHLNGEAIVLTGFNRHEDSPYHNMSPDPDLVRQDLKRMKDAGANFVRLCHHPHDPTELDLCDEIGLLVMAEIPLYGWKGRSEGKGSHNAIGTLRTAKRQLRAMISRDVNHPSIVLWSVSNETDESHPEVAAGNDDLIRLARRLDPTRLAVHVSSHWRDHPHFAADDIICVNGYPGYDNRRQDDQVDCSALAKRWQTDLATLATRYPDKPILITEFGYPAIKGCSDGAFSERTQAEIIEYEFKGMNAPYICGLTLCCWADHPWPENAFSYYNCLNQSPFGVLTRDRREKRGYHTIRALFRARQGYPEPQLRTELQASSAGYEVTMIRPHLDEIPQVAFPEGFDVRPMRLDEAGLWTDIWHDAEPYAEIKPELFHNQFGDDLQAIQWRSFIVTNPRGIAVATISAWYNRTFKGQDYGQIHWVAVRKSYWGRGLGKAMLTHALNHMAKWHDRAFLGTQTERIPAIKIYLDFGFIPDLAPPGAVQAWKKVKDRLDHPVLEALDLQRQAEYPQNQGGTGD
jgi:beta-glucuronidase